LGYKPKRTIRFVLFANEENGLRGGNKYAEEAKTKITVKQHFLHWKVMPVALRQEHLGLP
jgi:Zn-dependent M28 family amino/carboxypeptidase